MRAPVAAIALALVAVAPAVRADDAPGAEAAAQLHLDRGVDAFRAGEYARAHREFAAASELAPDKPNPYRWLALTEVQLGECRPALDHIEAFLSRVAADDPRAAELIRVRVLCERTLAEEAEPAPAPPARRPITRRWWFWPAVIGAAAAVTGAVIVLADEPDATVLPPIRCDGGGCQAGAP
jgi:hypothetical protein